MLKVGYDIKGDTHMPIQFSQIHTAAESKLFVYQVLFITPSHTGIFWNFEVAYT